MDSNLTQIKRWMSPGGYNSLTYSLCYYLSGHNHCSLHERTHWVVLHCPQAKTGDPWQGVQVGLDTCSPLQPQASRLHSFLLLWALALLSCFHFATLLRTLLASIDLLALPQ